MCSRRQGRPLDRRPPMTAIIPQDDLARVSPPNHQVGVETSKADRHHGGLWREKWRKICCEMVSGGLFYSEEETASHINSAPPGNHKATVQHRVSRTSRNRHRLSQERLTNVYSLKLEI